MNKDKSKYYVTWDEIFERLKIIDLPGDIIYGIPNGGMIAAGFLKRAEITHDPRKATVILDDILDSGKTQEKYKHFNKSFFPLFNKLVNPTLHDRWLVMPWENDHPGTKETSIQDNVLRQLQFIGEDPTREGLIETPNRVIKMYGEIFKGYKQDPADIFTVFECEGYDQIILLKDVEIFSMCLAGSTFIETPKGRIPISKLKDGEYVYCYDEQNCRMTLAKAKNPRITGKNKKLWRIYSDKDTILCTGNHKFLTHTRGWVEAKNLIPGDSIVALNKGANHRILLVEQTDWFEDVWCMDVPIYHNFIANGMVVHNCEHHMMPFFGKAHVAYIPDQKIVGISKLARLVDIYARRLQIQERIGDQVTTAIMELLGAKAAACVIEAQHLCMKMRGVEKQNSIMTTSSMKGLFISTPAAKQELMQLIK